MTRETSNRGGGTKTGGEKEEACEQKENSKRPVIKIRKEEEGLHMEGGRRGIDSSPVC